MAVKFTPKQQQVIDLRNRNILVSAAAGSGKTAVLVARIIKMITDDSEPVDIDRLLIVTFTNAAAAEMRERISQAISLRLEEEPDNIHLQKQATLLHNAQITTIHSFCLFVIRNHFNEIGLDPGFRVADEGEITLLKRDVLSNLLEQLYQEKKEAFLACVEYFTPGSNDRLLEEYIEKLYEFAMSYPWPEEWLGDRKKDYKITSVIEMQATPWCQYLTVYLRAVFEECRNQLANALRLTEKPDGPYMYGNLLEQEIEMLEALLVSDSLEGYYEGSGKISFNRLPSKKDDSVNPLYREKAKQIRNSVKKQLEGVIESYLRISPEAALERMQRAQLSTEILVDTVILYKEALDARKRKENIIDFHDMEHLALSILISKKDSGCQAAPAALEYRQFFHEILIDEYQDSNLVQELLLQSISGEEEGRCNRFMVGDVKQSIYKFRLARPELFMDKYAAYTKEDSDRQKIDLLQNFRSRSEVLASVNELFYRIMDTSVGGINYDREAALYPAAEYPTAEYPAAEYASGTSHLYKKNYDTEYILIEKDKESRLSAREQEALAVAARIRELIREFKVTDKETGQLRSVRYRDIVILLRTTSGWAEEFRRIFEKEGIPAYVASRTGYFAAAEIRELLELLHVVDNPYQDIPLFGAMKSYFGRFTDEEIALIRSENKTTDVFYEQLKTYTGALADRTKKFLEFLEGCRDKVIYTPIHQLMQNIVMETGYLYYVTAKPGGEQRQANVEMLLTKAAAFEKTSYYGLFHFLRYVEQLEKYEVDYGEADVLDENADVVRLLSIHKSKGLEFPVCMVAGISKRFNMQDTSGRLIADMDMGIGVDYVDLEQRQQSRTLRKGAVSIKLKTDNLGEELRVLYVAMTRAKEKLILTGMVADCDKVQELLIQQAEEQTTPKVPFSVLMQAGSYLDFILPCISEAILIRPEAMIQMQVSETISVIERKNRLLLSTGDNKIMTILSDKFNRRYAYGYLSHLFVKTSVSELKKLGVNAIPDESIAEEGGQDGNRVDKAFTRPLYEEAEVMPYIPSFIKGKEGITGTERGNAYHRVMELTSFEAIGRQEDRTAIEEEVVRQLDVLQKQEKISSGYRNAVAPFKLTAFFDSSLGKRMTSAAAQGKLYRERPFVMGLPATRINSEFPNTETVLIQGIIDAYFEEEGKIIVADYKTDTVKDPEELIKRYQVQLDYYAEALEKLTGKKVIEKIIYSFALNREVMIY